MRVYTAEGDTTRHLLSVGDTGVATITAFGTESGGGCLIEVCTVGLDGEFRSSDGNVVTPARVSFTGFAQVTLVGRVPGSAQVSATIQDSVLSTRFDVVPTRLPVDSVRVRRWPHVGDSVLEAATDAAGNVASLTLPYIASTPTAWNSASATLRIRAFRNGDSTVYLPVRVASSDSTVVWANGGCHDDINGCSWGMPLVVAGLAPGTETVTVTARNRQFSFTVTVR